MTGGVQLAAAALVAAAAFALGVVVLRRGASAERPAGVAFLLGILGGIGGAMVGIFGAGVYQGIVDPNCFDECHRYGILGLLVASLTAPVGAAVAVAAPFRNMRMTIGIVIAAHAFAWLLAAAVAALAWAR